jgi:hypothetical protein
MKSKNQVKHFLTIDAKTQKLVERYSVTKQIDVLHGMLFFSNKSNVQLSQAFRSNVISENSFENKQHISDEAKTNSEAENIRTPNFPMFSFWHKIKHLHNFAKYSFILTEFVGSMVNNNSFYKYVVLKLIMKIKVLDNFSIAKTKILDKLSISEKLKYKIWSDKYSGLNRIEGLIIWYEIAIKIKNNEVCVFKSNY